MGIVVANKAFRTDADIAQITQIAQIFLTQQVRISRRNLLVGFLVWIFSARKIPGGQFFKFLAEGTYSRESGESGESTDSASSFPQAIFMHRIACKLSDNYLQ